jgi:hypothetical protein
VGNRPLTIAVDPEGIAEEARRRLKTLEDLSRLIGKEFEELIG